MKQYEILFVDDDEFIRKIYTDRLTASGFFVDVAESIAGALRKLEKHSYDLICTDFLLADKTGIDLVNYVRGEKKSAVPIIMFSASGQEADKQKAVEAGVTEYVMKDKVAPSEFADKIRALIEQSHA